jgi:hypothetical protein
MPTILTYTIISIPRPLSTNAGSGAPSPGSVQVIALNVTNSDQAIARITIQFPVGVDASSMTANPEIIQPVVPESWILSDTQTPAGLLQYVFQSSAAIPKSHGVTFEFNNIEVNETAGYFDVKVIEETGNCAPNCPDYITTLRKVGGSPSTVRTGYFEVKNQTRGLEFDTIFAEGFDETKEKREGYSKETGKMMGHAEPGETSTMPVFSAFHVLVNHGICSLHWKRTVQPHDEGNFVCDDLYAPIGWYFTRCLWEVVETEDGLPQLANIATIAPLPG